MVKITTLLKSTYRIIYMIEYNRKTSKGYPRIKNIIADYNLIEDYPSGFVGERTDYIINISGPSKQIWNEDE